MGGSVGCLGAAVGSGTLNCFGPTRLRVNILGLVASRLVLLLHILSALLRSIQYNDSPMHKTVDVGTSNGRQAMWALNGLGPKLRTGLDRLAGRAHPFYGAIEQPGPT